MATSAATKRMKFYHPTKSLFWYLMLMMLMIMFNFICSQNSSRMAGPWGTFVFLCEVERTTTHWVELNKYPKIDDDENDADDDRRP